MFKEGDLIIARPDRPNSYNITTGDAVMKVIEINGSSWLTVEVVSHPVDRDYVGERYDVKSKYFIKHSISEKLLNKLLLENLTTLNLKTLDYEVKFNEEKMIVGCQTISKADALELADKIKRMYE